MLRKDITIPNSGGKRITLRAENQKELDKLVTETNLKIQMGVLCINSSTTFQNYAQTWLETYKKDAIGAKAYSSYESILKLHINPAIGALKMTDIKRSHCALIMSRLSGQSKSLLLKVRMTLQQIFEAAIDDDVIVKNPARNLQLPDATEGKRRSLTESERKHVINTAEHHRAGLWVLVMLYCGLRPSEAIALNWSDIDLKNKFISVNHSMWNREKTKTASGVRRVPIPDVLCDKLNAARKSTIRTFVFATEAGNAHNERSMRRMWSSFIRALDIDMGAKLYRNQIIVSVVADDITPYCLRHTYATDLQTAGVPLNVAKVLLGHSDIKITADIYTHYTSQNEQDAACIINQYYTAENIDNAAKVRQE